LRNYLAGTEESEGKGSTRRKQRVMKRSMKMGKKRIRKRSGI
jgi:hypothetical protein